MRNLNNCLGKSAGWDPEFSQSRKGRVSDMRKTWIEWNEEVKNLDDENDEACTDPSEEDGEDPSMVQDFVRGLQGSYVCHLEATVVENFCDSALLQNLRKGTVTDPLGTRNIWFAGNGIDTPELSRLQPQWLTPWDFYVEFGKHCTGTRGSLVDRGPGHDPLTDNDDVGCLHAPSSYKYSAKHSTPPADAAAIDQKRREQPQPSGDHLLIFVNDPDPSSFAALIGTASYHLASPLAKILYNHLAFVTSIALETWSDRFLTFQLSFSLPYFAWRNSAEPCSDHRRTRAEEPLRRSRDVSLLNLEPDKGPAFLYEAQLSCVVAGFDEWTWTAHCLADSYFDGDAGENAQQYTKDAADGANTNPFLYGLTEAERPIHKAREFFLRVFEVRLNLVRNEWQHVVSNVGKSVSKYEENHHYLLLQSSTTGNAQDNEHDIRKSFDWVNAVMSIATILSERLSKTVDACAHFTQNDAANFCDIQDISPITKKLQSIRSATQSLEGLDRDLNAIINRCREFERKLGFRIQLEAIRMGNHQSDLAKDSNKLAKTTQTLSTVMMIYVTPIAMSAGIFSTQENLMPPIPRNFVSFVVLTCIFAIASKFILKYQDEPVQLSEKVLAPGGWLLYGNVTRFCAVCTNTRRLLLRHTGMCGARANILWAQMARFVRRYPTNAPQSEVEELEMALPLRKDPTHVQYMACSASPPTESAQGTIELSYAVRMEAQDV